MTFSKWTAYLIKTIKNDHDRVANVVGMRSSWPSLFLDDPCPLEYLRVIKILECTIHNLVINYDVIGNSAQLFRIHTLQYFSIKILIKKSKLQFTFLDDHLKLNGHQIYKLLKQIKIVKIKIHTVPVWVAVMHCISKNTLQFLYADLLPSPS